MIQTIYKFFISIYFNFRLLSSRAKRIFILLQASSL